MQDATVILAEAKFLVSFWKPILLLMPFVGWGWIVSRVYDKHALRFHLGREKWNLIHLCFAMAAVAAGLLIPMKGEAAFWIGLAAAIVILAIDIVVYPMVVNKDERVPEEHRVRFNALAQMAKARADKDAAKKQGKVELKLVAAADKSVLAPPQAETPDFEVRTTAEGLVLKGFGNRASQVDLAPAGKDGAYGVSYLIDGVRPNQPEPMPAAMGVKVIDLWKSAAKLDINDRRRKLTGDVVSERGDTKTRLRVQTMGAQGGQRLTIIFDPEKQVRRKADDLGLLPAQLEALKGIVEEAKGVVLLAANADSGRTTTLYSVLRMHDAYTNNIQTVEMEPQDFIEGVRQNPFEQGGEGPEYSTFLRSILRRDPQVVGVGELPDDATAKELAKADHERTRCYLSMRTDSAMTALQAYVKAVGDPELAAKSLRGVVAQKLVRKLCTNCRVGYTPTPDILKTLGLPAGKVAQLFKKGGQVLIKNKPELCPVCQGIGYQGQEGVFEVFPIDQAARDLIKTGNFTAVQAELRKRQLPSIRQAAIAKVAAGATSLEELTRISSDAAKPAQGAKPAAAPAKPAAPAASKPAPKPPAKA